MFFAILWKNPEISLEELKLIQADNIRHINNFIITFNTSYPEKISSLWWIIKRWEIFKENNLNNILINSKILWTKDKNLWIMLKKKFNIKRFKITDIFNTDKEVKDKWIEIMKINSDFGIVKWYQNISLYEKIDFEKPARDMKMGMMPSKLTHIMLNIWLTDFNKKPIIYDPFAWSWTTWFLANFFWYDFVWSDIKTNYIIKNLERRQSTNLCKDNNFDIFQQNIFEAIKLKKENLIVVTEWRLWPIVTEKTTIDQINKYQNQVSDTYIELIKRIYELNISRSVFTIPYYIWFNNKIENKLQETSSKLWLSLLSINEIYKRENQKVWRKIIIINKN